MLQINTENSAIGPMDYSIKFINYCLGKTTFNTKAKKLFLNRMDNSLYYRCTDAENGISIYALYMLDIWNRYMLYETEINKSFF